MFGGNDGGDHDLAGRDLGGAETGVGTDGSKPGGVGDGLMSLIEPHNPADSFTHSMPFSHFLI